MKDALSLSLVVACVTAPVSAQTKYFVSPKIAATNEGAGSTGTPFGTTHQRRYMQIHSDLPAAPMRINAIGFRMSASTTTFPGVRVIDMEMFMGPSLPWNACSFYFDVNYRIPKTKVVARKNINFGPGITRFPGPSPWATRLEINLDAPYLRLPAFSLVWEVLIHSNSGGRLGPLDADVASIRPGSATVYGTGCVATGQRSPVLHTVEISDITGTLLMIFSARFCPANAPALLALGTKQLAVNVPGLCTKLYTDLLLLIPIGVSNAIGDLNRQRAAYWYNAAGGVLMLPNILPPVMYSQVFALDTGQSGIKLAGSNGAKLTIPTSDKSKLVEVTRLYNNFGGTTATMSTVYTQGSVGYCLPTRFTYQ